MTSLRLPALECFTGKHDEFDSFSRRLKAYFISHNEKYKKIFTFSEQTTEEITDELFRDEEELKLARDLHYTLVQLCKGTSEMVLLQADTENGAEEWRLLHRHYKRPSMNTSMGRLTSIVESNFINLEDDFIKWEAEISKFEKETSSLLPAMVKTAILMNKLDGPLQQYLQLHASYTTHFSEVREMVLNFSKAKTTFRQFGTSTTTPSFPP